MKLSITKEQYDEMAAERNPFVELTVEAQYFMEVHKRPLKGKKRRKATRSPLTVLRLASNNKTVKLPSQNAVKQAAIVSKLLSDVGPMAGGELGEKLAGLSGCTRDMASYWVTQFVERGVLEYQDA